MFLTSKGVNLIPLNKNFLFSIKYFLIKSLSVTVKLKN